MQTKVKVIALARLGSTFAAAVFMACLPLPSSAETNPCSALAEAHVAVDVTSHELFLCIDRKQTGVGLQIRIGRNGVGKQKEGDGKTPLGVYSLGHMRSSRRYGWFIPIGYPSIQQKRMGFTGGAVGIHGPDRRVAWLGKVVNWLDTTDGCIGLAYDNDVKKVGSWALMTKARRVRLYEQR